MGLLQFPYHFSEVGDFGLFVSAAGAVDNTGTDI